jgi:hypothetical protein
MERLDNVEEFTNEDLLKLIDNKSSAIHSYGTNGNPTSHSETRALSEEKQEKQEVRYCNTKVYRKLASGEIKCYIIKQKYLLKPKRTVYKGGAKPQPFKKELRDGITSMNELEAEEIIEYMKEYKMGKFRQ